MLPAAGVAIAGIDRERGGGGGPGIFPLKNQVSPQKVSVYTMSTQNMSLACFGLVLYSYIVSYEILPLKESTLY